MRSNKFVTVLTLVNFAFLVVLLISAAPTNPTDVVAPSVVRAQAIELVDAEGNVRGQLYLGVDGSGNLRLRNANGEVRVKLGTSVEGGTGLLLMDKKTEPAIWLGADKPGTSLTLTGPDKKQRVIAP
jgi:hypothetical protein